MRLQKRKGVWYACFTGKDGIEKRISTRQTDKSAAAVVARDSKIAEMEMVNRVGALNSHAYAAITHGSKVTISEAITEYEARKKFSRTGRTVEGYLIWIRNWAEGMKVMRMHPSQVEEQHIEPWINDPKSSHKLSSRKCVLAVLRNFFDFVNDKGWRAGNPARLIEINMNLLNHEQKEKVLRMPFTTDEIQKILDNTQGFWRTASIIGVETGMRLGDIAQLEWSCLNGGLLTVHTDKRNKRISQPMSYRLQNALAQVPVVHSQYVFPDERQKAIDHKLRSVLSTSFGRILQRLGIEGKSFHSFRSHYATRLDAENVPTEQIAKDLGHSSTTTTKGYIRHES